MTGMFEIRGGGDLRRVSAELRRMGDGGELLRAYRRELRAAAAPMVPAVRAAIAAIPAAGPASTGLRKRLQRATRLQSRTTGKYAGIRVLVDPKKMPSGEKSLPEEMEGTKRWRHPVFGNRSSWVTQQPHPYFFKTVEPLGARSRAGVAAATAAVERQVR